MDSEANREPCGLIAEKPEKFAGTENAIGDTPAGGTGRFPRGTMQSRERIPRGYGCETFAELLDFSFALSQ